LTDYQYILTLSRDYLNFAFVSMDYISIYANFLKTFLMPKSFVKVVFDSSDGTTGLVLRELFRGVPKMEPVFLNAEPNGNFPAHGPDPWAGDAMQQLGKEVCRRKADFGAIFDGDGDRVFFVDNLGRSISGDAAAVLIGKAFKGPLILDIRAGYVVRELFQSARRKIIDSRVGHFFIKKLMRKKRIRYGAEISGHYYFKDFFYCDSGIFAAIQFINSVSRLPGRLSDWIDSLAQTYRIPETNFEVGDKKKMMKKIEMHFRKSAKKTSRLDGIRMEFVSPDWWFSVRPSNTEDLLRLNLEAKDRINLKQKLTELKNLILSP